MPTVISYTWSQGRQLLAWGSPTPTPGRWYLDAGDPSWVNGVTAVWKAVPFWLALDFCHAKNGNLLALLSAPTDDGQRGRLQVYRGDGTYEPVTLTDYTELESSNVSGAEIGVRSSGEIDVFYVHGNTLKHRVSEDAGVTFSSATSFSLASSGALAFTPAAATYAYTSGGPMEADILGGYVHWDYLRTGGLAMIVHGRLAGAVTDVAHVVRAELNGSTWSFGPISLFSPGTGASNVFALRSGDFLTSTGRQINLQMTGSHTARLTSSVLGFGLDETHNLRLGRGGVGDDGSGNSDASGPFTPYRLLASALNAARTQWALTGQAAAPISSETIKGWRLAEGAGASPQNHRCRAFKARLRRDRRWELIYLNRSQQPELIRFKALTAAVTPLAWY